MKKEQFGSEKIKPEKKESDLFVENPKLRFIGRSLELLHSEPEFDEQGNRLPPDPKEHWTQLYEKVKPWETGLELSDNVRDAVRQFVAKKLSHFKQSVPAMEDLSDRKLIEALVHNWFESVEEDIGKRSKVLLSVMAHVVKRIETTAYREVFKRADSESLAKLGLDETMRDLFVDVLEASIDADPLFIRFLAYTQLSGKVPEDSSPAELFIPNDKEPHTVGELFPKETGRLGKHLGDIAASSEKWADKPGADIFKEYLEALSGFYLETNAEKASERQERISELYGKLVESGFPILLVPALEGYTKEPYLDPELRVCLATPDTKQEENSFREMQSAMAGSLGELGLGEFEEEMRSKTIRNVVAIGSYGVNLVFNAVAQEKPATLIYLNEQIRSYDKNFPSMMELTQETSEKFSGMDEIEKVKRMEKMSRADTIFHELAHNIFPEGSAEAGRFGEGRAETIINEVHAEALYRPLIPVLLEKGKIEGTKDQWAISTLTSSLQILRDQPPEDPYFYAAAFTLNKLFNKGVAVLENDKIVLRDPDAYWTAVNDSARELIALYRNKNTTEKEGKKFIKDKCEPNEQVKELKEFLENVVELKNELKDSDESVLALVKVIEKSNEEIAGQFSEIEQVSFPPDMQTDKETIAELLEEPGTLHILIKNIKGNNEGLAYLTAVPPDSETEVLHEYDLDFKAKKNSLYVESVAIIPRMRGKTFSVLWDRFVEEAKKRNITMVSMHARQKTLSPIMQKKFGYKPLRTIENWQGWGENFDYFEIKL